MTDSNTFRTEKDSMGEFEVPSEAYYGANTMRAIVNFPISNLLFPSPFIQAIANVKLCAAQVNTKLNLLDKKLSEAKSKQRKKLQMDPFTINF